ncbi:PucR family transcriptional regulator [Streptomyces cyaneus]|uniref:PucR family transcriptional regulator n=1 Tax=Streptomyces cyaneus TaxID=1904 RepID=UPI000FF8810C|nr:helix-turn-helix domain-containing protein [Streptomyces cyaneus]
MAEPVPELPGPGPEPEPEPEDQELTVADRERAALLARAVAPRVAALAGAIFDRTGPDESHLLHRVTQCLRIGLTTCLHERPLTKDERRELSRVGTAIAASGARPPALVGIHSVLFLGHGEALRACQENALPPSFSARLEEGAKRLLPLSEEMAGCIADGYAEERFGRGRATQPRRPVDALCSLITGPTDSWRRTYLTKIVQKSGLDGIFPAVMAIAQGHVGTATEPTTLRIGNSANIVVAPVAAPDPHTLILCPAASTGPFMLWLRRTVTTTTVHTRAVTFEEAPARYTATRDILTAGDPIDHDERFIDARSLFWHRMLRNQRIENVGDYVEEVIGPILRLPETQRIPLLETLHSLDKHNGSVRAAAASLNIHEKTLRYRVGRIEALTGLNALTRNHWPQLNQACELFENVMSRSA